MAKKSNKTAHVLNLISGSKHLSETNTEPIKQDAETNAEINAEINAKASESDMMTAVEINAASKIENAAQINPTIKKSLEKSAKNEALSNAIKNSLEKEFLEHTSKEDHMDKKNPDLQLDSNEIDAASSPADFTEEHQDSPSDDKTAPISTSENHLDVSPLSTDECSMDLSTDNASPNSEIAENPSDEIDANVSENHTISENIENSDQPALDQDTMDSVDSQDYLFLNVYEKLVREQVDEYMDRFHVCKCKRCVADTMALALSNLPSKYVVVTDENIVPFISFYESKYKLLLMTELTKACLTVINNPRH